MEKEILVKDFSELEIGMRIVVKPTECTKHSKHKYFILKSIVGFHKSMALAGIGSQLGFELLPSPSCKPGSQGPFLGSFDVDRGVVYKIVDLQEQSNTTTKKLELVE